MVKQHELKKDLRVLQILLVILFGVGLLVALLGFVMWYLKDQRVKDGMAP